MTTDSLVVRDTARRPSVDDTAREGAWRDAPEGSAYVHSGATEDGKREASRRSLRWMELGWEGTTAAREEATKEAVLEMLRGLVADSRRGIKAFVARWEAPW